ncbi:hypothetical protein C1H46_013431 [Malus baccata]|uniref:AAA+ ATPase domain-containing protein n=1 Tax=Malus baccata TaxID=106549 RepID=A0A540MQ22_MALBA|nr:hypothetical protein C1H46_013431 [Malus baccata]
MEIIIAIGSKIGECLVTPIGTEFGYLVNYHSNLESLRGEIKKLFDKKDGVQGLVDAAKRNGEIIKPDVQSWLKNANDDMVKKVLQFEDEINKKRRCVYRWSLSRRAYKITQEVLQLQNEGRFENVAHPAPPPEIWSTIEKGFKDFKSRKENMNEVIEGLKREEVRMIGICGMGGVGKTTMVKEIIARLAKLNLFDKIVMATVSHSPSIRTIQSEIADEIGLQFKEESEPGRARRLHGRLMGIERILIVLDDAWTELGFAAIGLPYGDAHKGCKVLLTSRDSDVCNRMGSQQIIAVPILTTEESQELFREMVGESVNDPDLRSIAKEVVKECGGLPIAIVTVGKALEKKSKREWDDALNQLRNSTPVNIPGVNVKVYSSIKLSYDRLESDEVSNIFTLEDARNRVHSLVGQLKRRFLLLDSGKSEATKMHDVVHDVAIWIASRDPHGFLIRSHAENKGWPNLGTYNHYTTISLVGELEIQDGLKCPKLEHLQTMEGRFSEGSMDNICDAMKELKVLALVEMKELGSLTSLGVLKNLRTLCLDGSKFDCMSTDVIGGLENLEILSFRGCDSMRELPREIGRLKQLRLLDTTRCWKLEVIPHGIFSSLCRLEELYMCNSFRKWELGTGREDKGMASISEVMSLSHHLKVLSINIPSVIHLLPKDMVLKSPTIRFGIWCGTGGTYVPLTTTCAFENCLAIGGEIDARKLMESQAARLLLKKSKKLMLYYVKNFSVLTDLDQEGFQDLKDLELEDCPNTEYLANGTSAIQQTLIPCIPSVSQLTNSFLTNLKFLRLSRCGVLKYVFSLSAARNLVQLQELNIDGCDQMEEIVSKQGREHEEEADMISFHKLTNLTLWGLQSLETTARVEHQSAGLFEKAIFPSKCISWLPSLEEVTLQYMKFEGVLFDLKIHTVMDGQTTPIFPQLRKLEIFDCSFTHLWKNIPSGFQGFRNLRYLKITGCSGLKYVFSHLIARELLNLEEVKILACPDMENIVRITEEIEEEATKDMILFPKLNTFELVDLPRLTSLCPEGFTFLWSSAKNMHVEKCERLKTLGAVIPQRKKLENKSEKDSTSHDFRTSPTHSSNRCPVGCGCTPYSRPNTHRSIEILPRPINLERSF